MPDLGQLLAPRAKVAWTEAHRTHASVRPWLHLPPEVPMLTLAMTLSLGTWLAGGGDGPRGL